MHTTTDSRPYAADVLASVADHWGWLMGLGLITMLAGVAVLAWPGPTLLVLAIFFGIQLIVTGIFRFVTAFAADELTGGTRALLAVLGIISLIVGLYAVRHVLITLIAMALLLGIFWIVNGAAELFMALSRHEMRGRAWTALLGVLSVLAGVIVLIYPAISLLTLAVVLGIWLLVQGGMQIAMAVQARSASHRVRPARRVPVM